MKSSLFEEHLKICAYRLITENLLEKNLITPEEAAKVKKHISKMEIDLIKAETPQAAEHLREQSAA